MKTENRWKTARLPLSEGNKICLPATVRLTDKHIISNILSCIKRNPQGILWVSQNTLIKMLPLHFLACFWRLILSGRQVPTVRADFYPHNVINKRTQLYNKAARLTGTFHALVYEAVQQRATVVAEGRTGVSLDLERVSTL